MPGAGASPPEQWALRGRLAESFVVVRSHKVGKTVVPTRAAPLARDAGLKVCLIEAHERNPPPLPLAPPLRRMLLELDRLGALSEHVKRASRMLKTIYSPAPIHRS
jgi:hypothetical protein